MSPRDDFENDVFNIIKNRPASAETMSVITGQPTNYVLMKLYVLEKYKIIERVTMRKMIIWGFPRGDAMRGKRKA